MWRWWKLNWREATSFAACVVVTAIVAMTLTGRIVFGSTLAVEGWTANFTNGFLGAAFGAGVAIWWAVRERSRIVRERRASVNLLLQHEVTFIVANVVFFEQNPYERGQVSTDMLDQLESFADLFDPTTLGHLIAFRAVVRSLVDAREKLLAFAPVAERPADHVPSRQWQARHSQLIAEVKRFAGLVMHYSRPLAKMYFPDGKSPTVNETTDV